MILRNRNAAVRAVLFALLALPLLLAGCGAEVDQRKIS